MTNLDVSTTALAATVEHWYRHRTEIENIFRDSKHGAALRHLPSGYPQVNTAWMWGALLAASVAGWLHQLTTTPAPDGGLLGWGVRKDKAMITTLRHRLIRVSPQRSPCAYHGSVKRTVVRHEALFVRVEVGDLHRPVVVAVG